MVCFYSFYIRSNICCAFSPVLLEIDFVGAWDCVCKLIIWALPFQIIDNHFWVFGQKQCDSDYCRVKNLNEATLLIIVNVKQHMHIQTLFHSTRFCYSWLFNSGYSIQNAVPNTPWLQTKMVLGNVWYNVLLQ